MIVYNDSCLAATAFINREKSKSAYRWKEVTDEEGFPVAVVLCSKQQLSQPVVGTQGTVAGNGAGGLGLDVGTDGVAVAGTQKNRQKRPPVGGFSRQ